MVCLQLAGYAYSVAFARIHIMQKTYRPAPGAWERERRLGTTGCTAASYTATARRNYAEGLLNGLRVAVQQTLKSRVEERAAKLRRANDRATRARSRAAAGAEDVGGPAYESDGDDWSGEEHDDDDDVGTGPQGKGAKEQVNAAGAGAAAGLDAASAGSEACGAAAERIKAKMEAAEAKLATLTRQADSAQALVIHGALGRRSRPGPPYHSLCQSAERRFAHGCLYAHAVEAVSAKVLEKEGIKLRKGAARKRLVEFNAAAFAQGRADAQKIDLDQHALPAPSG
eukprot:SAG22_NODE_4786_length_1164_cov_1.168075_1_plen_284_part_00